MTANPTPTASPLETAVRRFLKIRSVEMHERPASPTIPDDVRGAVERAISNCVPGTTEWREPTVLIAPATLRALLDAYTALEKERNAVPPPPLSDLGERLEVRIGVRLLYAGLDEIDRAIHTDALARLSVLEAENKRLLGILDQGASGAESAAAPQEVCPAGAEPSGWRPSSGELWGLVCKMLPGALLFAEEAEHLDHARRRAHGLLCEAAKAEGR